jgi:DNA adenine methylase
LKKHSLIKSPLRYPGGKSKALKQIAPLVPLFNEYREPFVGGGSLFFYLKQEFPYRQYWINDLYQELYAFWLSSRDNNAELISIVQQWKETYSEGKELFAYLKENIKVFDLLHKAAAFFVFNRITFSGTAESGGYSQQAYDLRFTNSSIERVRSIESILVNAEITNYDYQDVINQPGNDVFIFLDPPYHSATKSSLYGKNGNLHKGFDHERFAGLMQECNHNWLITYDDTPYIRSLFPFANIFSWDLKYGMRNVNKNSNNIGQELFISNYLQELPKNLQNSLEFTL